MLSFYHTYHCKHIIAESLSLGRKNWSLQTIILLSDKEVIKELIKEYKLKYWYIDYNVDIFDQIYNQYYLTPDYQKYNTINQSMCLAAKYGNLEIVDQMLDKGANEYNYAMKRAAENGHIEIVDKMIALGTYNYDWSMIYAAKNGHLEIVKLLNFRR